jgi:hypothetical protein
MSSGYYPDPNDRRADWWVNINTNIGEFQQLGFDSVARGKISADADWALYVYRTVREAFDNTLAAILAYCDVITDAPDGSPAPAPPAIPAWPTPPTSTLIAGIEARRLQWVAKAKASPNYNASVGALLGLEAPASTFDPATYQAELSGLSSPAARTVSGKFRKARGNIDGINLYGRKEGTMEWIALGRFTASPFTATVPLSGAAPEAWEFLARAVKRDVEIGVASDVVQVIVRG